MPHEQLTFNGGYPPVSILSSPGMVCHQLVKIFESEMAGVSILSSPGMVCHPAGLSATLLQQCFYPVITRNGMPHLYAHRKRMAYGCFYPVITRNGMPLIVPPLPVLRVSGCFYPVITRNGMPRLVVWMPLPWSYCFYPVITRNGMPPRTGSSQ